MQKTTKEFDSVKIMRKTRKELAEELKEMTWSEKNQYIKTHVTFLDLNQFSQNLLNSEKSSITR